MNNQNLQDHEVNLDGDVDIDMEDAAPNNNPALVGDPVAAEHPLPPELNPEPIAERIEEAAEEELPEEPDAEAPEQPAGQFPDDEYYIPNAAEFETLQDDERFTTAALTAANGPFTEWENRGYRPLLEHDHVSFRYIGAVLARLIRALFLQMREARARQPRGTTVVSFLCPKCIYLYAIHGLNSSIDLAQPVQIVSFAHCRIAPLE